MYILTYFLVLASLWFFFSITNNCSRKTFYFSREFVAIDSFFCLFKPTKNYVIWNKFKILKNSGHLLLLLIELYRRLVSLTLLETIRGQPNMLLGFYWMHQTTNNQHPPTLYKLKKLQSKNQLLLAKALPKESLMLEIGNKRCYHVALVITFYLLIFNWNSTLFTPYSLHCVIFVFYLTNLKIKLLYSQKRL